MLLAAGTCGRTRHRGKMTQFTTPDPATQDVLDMGMSMTIALSINTIHAFCFIFTASVEQALDILKPQVNKNVCPQMICKGSHFSKWIMCDHCNQWFHMKCVNVTESKAKRLQEWHCSLC